MELTLPWYFFDATATDEIKPGCNAESDVAAEKEKRIFCRFCQGPVTDKSKQTTPQGRFIHVRTNPGGFTFEFGCFSDAPGCSATGEATTEHTWFPGHSWKLAICRSCGEHLGWSFRGDTSFYGLILDRLVEEE